MRVVGLCLLLATAIVACSRPASGTAGAPMHEHTIEEVLAMHNDSLMALPGVVGTAIGLCDGAPCIRIFVRDSAAARRNALADKLGGYPLRVEISGQFHAR